MNVKLPDWADCLFDESLRYIALKGGRGGAKSRAVGSALIVRAANKPLRVLCTREIQNSIKNSVKKLLDDEVERLQLQNFYTSTDNEVRGRNGSLFIFSGLRSNADSIKSLEKIDLCWVEESQTVSQSSLDILIPTIRQDGSQLLFTWNPKNESDPVDKMFCGKVLPPRTVVKHVNYSDNPWFPDVLREEMEYDRSRDIDKYNHIWLGQYERNSEARIFKNWTVNEFEAPQGTTFRMGMDFGFASDPSVVVRCYVQGNKLFIDHESWGMHVEVNNLPKLIDKIPNSKDWLITADSSRPETISYLRHHGYPRVIGAAKGKGSILEGIAFLKSFDIVVHPRCLQTIKELTHYKYITDKLTNQVTAIPEDESNHVIDGLRYATEALRKANYKAFGGFSVPSL